MDLARLEITDSLGRRVVPIDKDSFTIGRRTGNDLRLVGADISREHAEIARTDTGFLLRDRQSRFGTYINGLQVSEQLLKNGDLIRLGQSGGVEMAFLVDTGAQPVPGQTVVVSAPQPHSTATATAGGELRQVAALLEGLRGLGSARVLDEVLALVIDSAIEISGAERGFIMLADGGGTLEFKLARARGKVTLSGKTFETSRKIPEEVFTTGEAKVVADLMDGDLMAVHTGTIALGIRHVFCIPLRLVRYVDQADASAEQKRIGVLYLDSRERGTLASSAVRTGLETLATEAAVAIENARLYREAMEKARMEHDLRIAAEIQQALLPPPTWAGPHFEVVARTVPCRAIGGDFFEYQTLPDDTAAFAVADVSGKGAPAALLTAVIQGVLSAQASSGDGPARTLLRINDVLIRRGVSSRFVTMFYTALTPDGRLTYCNAGHNPPFLVSGKTIRRLETGGMICGLFPAATYDEETVQLQAGDYLVMFSDGVSEALNAAGEEFGDPRIEAAICGECTDAAAVLERLGAAVRDFSAGALQSDDMTMVVLRYKGQA